MDAWRPKHVEDQDTIKWLWKWKCIKLATLLWYIMIHGQKNVKFNLKFEFSGQNKIKFYTHIQNDQNVSVHLMITAQKTRNDIWNSFNNLPR
jgi:hypothetical protein